MGVCTPETTQPDHVHCIFCTNNLQLYHLHTLWSKGEGLGISIFCLMGHQVWEPSLISWVNGFQGEKNDLPFPLPSFVLCFLPLLPSYPFLFSLPLPPFSPSLSLPLPFHSSFHCSYSFTHPFLLSLFHPSSQLVGVVGGWDHARFKTNQRNQ